MKVIIKGEFPTLNEVIKASKAHYMAYANQKKDYTALALTYINKLDKLPNKYDWTFYWFRKNRRNDPDNIQVGTKYILNAIVKDYKLKIDGWIQNNSIAHQY